MVGFGLAGLGAVPDVEGAADATPAFARAISEGDLAAATNCFTRDACLETPDLTLVRSRDDIRPVLAQLIAAGSQIQIEESLLVPAGEVALADERWLLTSSAPEGGTFARVLTPTLVLRRIDGVWKLAVAMPWRRR